MSQEFMNKLDSCFISSRRKNDKIIKDAVYKNIKQVESFDMQNVHNRVIDLLNIQSRQDSCYFEFEVFLELLKEAGAVVIDDKTLNEFNII